MIAKSLKELGVDPDHSTPIVERDISGVVYIPPDEKDALTTEMIAAGHRPMKRWRETSVPTLESKLPTFAGLLHKETR